MRIVLVGAGLAAQRCAESLRANGHDGPITMIGAERHAPYDRPPLSKAILAGERPDLRYKDLDVELLTGTRVTHVDARVHLDTGDDLPYDKVLIATGAEPVRLPGLEHAHTLRTLDDAIRLDDALRTRTPHRDRRRRPDRPGGRLRRPRPRRAGDPDRRRDGSLRRADGPGRRPPPQDAARAGRRDPAPRPPADRGERARAAARRRHRRRGRPDAGGDRRPPGEHPGTKRRLHRRRRDRLRPLGGGGEARGRRRTRDARAPAAPGAAARRLDGPVRRPHPARRRGPRRDAARAT